MIKYYPPSNWLNYDILPLIPHLTDAKAAMLSLVNIPYQKSWVEALQAIQLKREIAGTSKIEGAEFTERELDVALKGSPQQLLTRSQKQAHAAMNAYKWINSLPKDRPINAQLIKEIHALIIGDADSDHCQPGTLRKKSENVTFGIPPHRGCEGGDDCEQAFAKLMEAVQGAFQGHDITIRALALHYHFAAMHPFMDGNGRTARAVEALMLQRAGLTDHLFIAMSNYYYDEKSAYLEALSAVRPPDYNLTPFLIFGLKGIKIQCERLFSEIRVNVSKSVFRNTMYDLFGRLQTERKAVIAKRHIGILNVLLQSGDLPFLGIMKAVEDTYKPLKAGKKALVRDVIHLLDIGALAFHEPPPGPKLEGETHSPTMIGINLDWPKEITENGYLEKVRKFPKNKHYSFLTDLG